MLKPVIKVREIIQRVKKYFYKNLQILRIGVQNRGVEIM